MVHAKAVPELRTDAVSVNERNRSSTLSAEPTSSSQGSQAQRASHRSAPSIEKVPCSERPFLFISKKLLRSIGSGRKLRKLMLSCAVLRFRLPLEGLQAIDDG